MDKIGHFREDDSKRIASFFRRRGDRKQARPSRPRRRIQGATGTSVELQRCSDSLKVYAENVEVGGGERLLDVAGQVVSLLESALLESDCYTVVGESDCPPEICPEVGMVLDNCSECVPSSAMCIEFRPCNPSDVSRFASLSEITVGGTIRFGNVVLLTDGKCYTILASTNCTNTEPVSIVERLASCNACLECWNLDECFGTGGINIFKDNHNLSDGDVIRIGGVCYTVNGEPPNCDFSIHVAIQERFPPVVTGEDPCNTCGCYLLTPCDPALPPITTVGSTGVELIDGKTVLLDDMNCYRVSKSSTGCASAVAPVTVLESYDNCVTCVYYEMRDLTLGCDATDGIITYSDLSSYSPGTILRRAEDEKCYAFVREVPPFEFAVEFTVEDEYGSCEDCRTPTYTLTPGCGGCNCDGTTVGGGSTEVTDSDLSALVGMLVKIDDTCYTVSESPADAAITLPGASVSGPFSDCAACEQSCEWVVTNVTFVNGVPTVERARVIVDKVCERDSTPLDSEPCPTPTGP